MGLIVRGGDERLALSIAAVLIWCAIACGVWSGVGDALQTHSSLFIQTWRCFAARPFVGCDRCLHESAGDKRLQIKICPEYYRTPRVTAPPCGAGHLRLLR